MEGLSPEEPADTVAARRGVFHKAAAMKAGLRALMHKFSLRLLMYHEGR